MSNISSPKKNFTNKAKRLLFPTLLAISLLINILFLLKFIPVESVNDGCSQSRKEVRYSLIFGDRDRMETSKIRAEEVRENQLPKSEPPFGIAEGVSVCDGTTYKLYIL